MINQDNHKKEIWQMDFWQLTALNAAVTFGAIIPFSALGRGLGRNLWLAVIGSIVAGSVLCLFLSKIHLKLPGKSLYDVNNIVWGKQVGSIVNAVFLVQFFLMYLLIINSILEFWQIFGTGKDSYFIYAVIIIGLTLLAAFLGIETIARVAMITVPVLFMIFILDVLIVLPQVDLERILPVGGVLPEKVLAESWQLFILQFGLFPMSLMVTPYLKDTGKAAKSMWAAFYISSAYIIFSGLRAVFLLGDGLVLYQYPILQALRMVEWGPVFSRFELIGILIILANGMVLLMMINFNISLMIKKMLGAVSYRSLISPVAVIELILVLFFRKYIDNLEFDYRLLTQSIIMGLAVFSTFFVALKRVKKQNIYRDTAEKEEKRL